MLLQPANPMKVNWWWDSKYGRWACTVVFDWPRTDQVIVGMQLKDHDAYEKEAILSLSETLVHGEISSTGSIHFWEPFRLPTELAYMHEVKILLTPKTLPHKKADPPNVQLECDDYTGRELLYKEGQIPGLMYFIELRNPEISVSHGIPRASFILRPRHPHVNKRANNVLFIALHMFGFQFGS